MVDRKAVVVPTYRDTTLGQSLNEALRDMVSSSDLSEANAQGVLETFDRQVFEQFKGMPRTRPAKLSGTSSIYNNVDEIWKFTLKNMEVKDDALREQSDLCLVVSMSARNNPIDPHIEEETRGNNRRRGARPNSRNH